MSKNDVRFKYIYIDNETQNLHMNVIQSFIFRYVEAKW